MPTASPIIDASVDDVADRPHVLASAVIDAMPTPTPMTAVSRGNPAATSELNVIRSTTAAIPTPMTSLLPMEGDASSAVPSASTVSPASLPCWAAFSLALCVALVISAGFAW